MLRKGWQVIAAAVIAESEVVAKGYHLKCGNMKSCGCLRKEQREKWTEAGRASYKLPKTLCVSCIRSAAPPELQCIWDASKAQQLPEDAETVIIDTEGGNGTRHIYVVKCPQYLSLFDTNNAKLLQEARRRNDAWMKRELAAGAAAVCRRWSKCN